MKKLLWIVVAVLGAFALATIALHQGQTVSAAWVVIAAVCVYLIGYRFYSKFVAYKVLGLDAKRMTPANKFSDGLDYVPTDKRVLFGHHFAAIAGAGPLVGPILAAQMGYLPGMLWLLVGVVFAGAVQDMVVLFFSIRRDGKSLGQMVQIELGRTAGVIASIGTIIIMVILLAVFSMVVVKALANSPWGTFTVSASILIALLMGVYSRFIRPGRVGEMSVIGVVLLLISIVLGGQLHNNPLFVSWFTLTPFELAWSLMLYAFLASLLPIWLLLAPRDYLTTYLKIGTIVLLALGILLSWPELKMPAITTFIDGTGPVLKGGLFPFLFITIACGAVSGFHALISSGTTPKMIGNERDIPIIGYGAMLMESLVSIMALIAACTLDPGVYFAMNSPAAIIGTTAGHAAQVISQWGFVITPDALTHLAKEVGEQTLLSRAGGAPTFAVGMAEIFSRVLGGAEMKAFWYHFAILFEALFILTALDAGTRVGRFMLQDWLGSIYAPFKRTDAVIPNVITSLICVLVWGGLLYQGITDPWGGINTFWPLFGISNQILADIALIFATCVLFKMKKQMWCWVTGLPALWLLITTLSTSYEKLFSSDPMIGFLAQAKKYSAGISSGTLIAPTKDMAQMHSVVFNNRLDAALTMLMAIMVIAVTLIGLRVMLKALRNPKPTVLESEYITFNETKV